jgi:UDP-GlcNAc3NAcA epimerase
MRIVSVVGARPNFIKMAPLHKAISNFSHHTIIHTGQHYDFALSEIFFEQFDLPHPDFDLNVGSGTACYQMGEMIKRLESILLDLNNNNNNNSSKKIDLVLVYGDTNSTFAGAFSAMKCGIKVAHVESGLRSFDRQMPEETNRVLTDHISNYLFAPTKTAVANLARENVSGNVFFTGDIGVEVLRDAVHISSTKSEILARLKLSPKSYILFTMHRAENTESESNLISVIRAFEILAGSKGISSAHDDKSSSWRGKKEDGVEESTEGKQVDSINNSISNTP